MLLEKAFAGMDKSGYEELEKGGVANEALVTMLGHRGDRIHGWADADEAMAKLRAAEKKDEVVICTTPQDETKRMAKYNIHGWHAYVLDDIVGGKMKFRNPWGTDQPKLVDSVAFSHIFTGIQTMPVDDVKDGKDKKKPG